MKKKLYINNRAKRSKQIETCDDEIGDRRYVRYDEAKWRVH